MNRRSFLALACSVAAVTLMPACSSDQHGDEMAATPTDDSPEAGFARDMSEHHSQAVAMAEAIRDRTTDPDLRLLAADIALGQQGQIGRMSGWLDEWGLTISSANPPMAWVTTDDHGMPGMDGMTPTEATPGIDPATGSMPGMVTRPQITALSTLPVAEAEVSFLRLMIGHHLGGIEMAQAILARTERLDVVRLATSIVNSQQSEITVMQDMLAKRGVTS